MSADEATIGLATIVVFGVGCQWIGRRLGIPSLLLLLPAGLLAGDVLGWVQPQQLFGDLLSPLVTLLVGLLLFQAASQLHLVDLPREAKGSVARLVTVGLAVTFAGAVAASLLFLDVPRSLAVVTGSVLVVSGPTVVGPLLEVVRPRHPTSSILRWEGTALDPLGATVGVVVLNLVLAADRGGVHPVLQLGGRFAAGILAGLLAGALLILLMSRFWLTDDMEAAVALMLAAGAYAAAELVASEAGLFATVAMGVVVANQRTVATNRIEGFGETLEVLIIGTLFITLGALVTLDDLARHAGAITGIVVVLVLVVRPLTVAVSLFGTRLPGRDKAMIAWMDPRGVVAASTATTFTASLDPADGPAPPLPAVSLQAGVHEVRRALEEADIDKAVLSFGHGASLSLLEPDLVELVGRRHVLTVPREVPDDVVGLAPLRATAPAFRGEASRDDLGRRHQAGAQVREVRAPLPPGAVLLAVVSPGGDVHLRRSPGAVRSDDCLIALVDPA